MTCFRSIAGIVLLAAAAASWAAATTPPEILVVDDFERGPQNRLGGYHEKFQAGESTARIDRDSQEYRGHAGNSLSVMADRRTTGFCGVWLQFFDFRAAQRSYFDARAFSHLSFWVKGRNGNERFTVKLADRRWIEKEDSIAVGEISKFLPKGVTTNWQEVLIPLTAVKSLDLQNLGGLTIDFTEPGQHAILIDDVSFKVAATAITPLTEVGRKSAPQSNCPRSMWIWESRDIILDPVRRDHLFETCRSEGIEQLWMQIQYNIHNTEPDEQQQNASQPAKSSTSKLPNRATCEIVNADAWQLFIADAHRARLQIHALDGLPEFALRTRHHIPLAVVDAVIAFNRQSTAEQRFDGIHLDNEPYLLPGWEDATRRGQILREFFELNMECQQRVRTQSDMKFGIDIPFWWQDVDRESGKPMTLITIAGKKKAASFHCIDMFDQVGIMNYRDSAEGADGMIAHGQDLLEYAQQARKAKIYMGVETSMSAPADVWFIVGVPRKRFGAAVRGPGSDFASLSRIENMRIHRLDDGQNIHIGLELPPQPTEDDLRKIQFHLVQIAEQFGAASTGASRTQLTAARDGAENRVRVDPEWSGYRSRDIAHNGGREVAGFVATNRMLPKLTFADNTVEDLRSQVRSAEIYFSRSNQFAGIAIHSYESFEELRRQKTGVAAK